MAEQTTNERKRKFLEALKSARNVFVFSFVGLFSASALGYVREVADWSSSSGAKPLPAISTVGYAAVSALVAAAPAAAALIYRGGQALLGVGDQPTYTNSPDKPTPPA